MLSRVYEGHREGGRERGGWRDEKELERERRFMKTRQGGREVKVRGKP